MKKTMNNIGLYLAGMMALLILVNGQTAHGQTGNPSLDRLSAHYSKLKTLEADFSFRYYRNDQDQTGQSESGTILLNQQTGKYRITTPQQVLISDGSSQWAILRDADEVQVTEVDRTAEGITPFNVFSFFNQGYTHRQLSPEKSGSLQLEVIELTPEDKRKNFSKIILRINSSGQLHDVTIHDKNKSRYSYHIDRLKTEPVIDANKFVFDRSEFPGMEIVDLR